jgi:hypothetical protein
VQFPLFHPTPHCSQPLMHSRPPSLPLVTHATLFPPPISSSKGHIPLLLSLPQLVVFGPLPRLVSNHVFQIWLTQFASCSYYLWHWRWRQCIPPKCHWALLNHTALHPKRLNSSEHFVFY